MKVGVLTYHRSHNYGAMLQAMALRLALQEMGHNVHYIDYWPQHQKNMYRLFSWEDFRRYDARGKASYFKAYLKRFIPSLMRRHNFNRFFQQQIKPYCSSQDVAFDVIVYGSDQIWRKQRWGYGYNPVYFGKNEFKAKRQISYAASMGVLPNEPEEVAKVVEYVKCLDKVSVRETDLKRFLLEYGFLNVEQTVDPTLLIKREDWSLFAGNKRIVAEPYLLYYDLQEGTFEEEEVYKYAIGHRLKVIKLSGGALTIPSEQNRTTDGSYEFLNLMKYADIVCTSSFHGLVFSLIFNRPFFSAFSSNGGRAESLLNALSLSNYLLTPRQKIGGGVPKIDWQIVNERLDNCKHSSIHFIRDYLCSINGVS